MAKSKADQVIKINTLILDQDNSKPQLLLLKSGREIYSRIFWYNNSTVHGTNINEVDFKFNISDLDTVRPLTAEEVAEKKDANKTKIASFNK